MKPYFFLITALLWIFQGLAQKPLPGFGEAIVSEMELKECSFEKDAHALKLFDVYEVEIESGSVPRIVTERRVRIKIFNEEGFKYANVKIPFYNEKGSTKIKDFSAVIYNIDESGRIITERLDQSDVFKQNLVKNYDFLAFTFPNLKKGSVIEYTYRKIEKNITQIDPWIIQDEIPTEYSALTIAFPEKYQLLTKTFGVDSVRFIKQYKNFTSTWAKEQRYYVKENIKSFKPEPFMSSLKDNLIKMAFILRFYKNALTEKNETAWKLLAGDLLESELFGKQIDKQIPGTKSILDTAKTITPIASRIEYLFEKVKNQIPEITEASFYSEDIEVAWNERKGTTGDVNLILLNLLKKANIETYPILISTRDNGMIDTQFPSLSQINGVNSIVVDKDDIYVLDASQKHSFKLPPLSILNRNVYLLKPKDMRWIYVSDPRILQKIQVKIAAELKSNGNATGEASLNYIDFGKDIITDTINTNAKNRFFEDKEIGVNVLTTKVTRGNMLSDPIVHKVQFEYEPMNDGKFYYLSPHFLGKQSKNPFVNDLRNTDIDFGCNQKFELELLISLPPELKVEYMPASLKMRSSDTTMVFSRMTYFDESTIIYKHEFEIKRAFFQKDEYTGVRQFFEKMFAYLKEEIILKKST